MYKDKSKKLAIRKPGPILNPLYIWLSIICIRCGALNAQEDTIPPYERFYRQAKTLQDSAKYKESLPLLKKALKENSVYWEAYNGMAYAHFKMNKYKDALKSLDKAEQIAPMNYQSEKLRGIVQYHNEKYAESKMAFDTATFIGKEENIEDAELMYYLALLMFKGKSYKSVLGVCEDALDIAPRMWELMVLKGEARFALREPKYAIKEYTDAIALMKPEKTEYRVYKLRAQARFDVGDFKGAVSDWDVYIDAMGKDEESLIARGAAKININDNTGAIADLDQAIAMNSKNPVSWCYRGVAKGGNKSYIEAMKDLDQSIKLKFDYPTAYVNRAAIKMASKDKQGACKDLEKADSLGSETAYKLIEKYCK